MKKIVWSILLAGLLAACASEKPKDATPESKAATPAKETPAATQGMPAAAPISSSGLAAKGAAPADEPANADSLLSKRSVYYPFDVSVVQEADRPLVQAHAKFLSEHPGSKVHLEGNCDERGSGEYNLALGQRRADGVKKLLLIGGVSNSQIDAVSYGEEKPKLTCHEEKCWQENRRTDINYSAE